MKINELNVSDIEKLSASLKEQSWLRDLRIEAMDIWMRSTMPSRSDEEWRRTDPGSFMIQRWRLSLDDYRAESGIVTRRKNSTVELYNGKLRKKGLSDGYEGIEVKSIGDVDGKHTETVYPFLRKLITEKGYFEAMRLALLNGGVVIDIPENARPEKPLFIREYFSGIDSAVFSQLVIFCGRGSSITIIEDLISDEGARFINNGLLLCLDEGSSVEYCIINRLSGGSILYRYEMIIQENSAELHLNEGIIGGRIIKKKTDVKLDGINSKVNIAGFSLIDSGQHIDIFPYVVHEAAGTEGIVDFRSVLSGRGRFVFQGLIDIKKGASRANSFLSNRNLILTSEARADSIPRLQIDNNDVKAGHAVTTGRINEEQLFYLMSRGLSRKEAEFLMVNGFLEPVFSNISIKYMKNIFTKFLMGKLGV